ncbi:TAXI family TRAP transporter solute-binding subunit [Pseudonocardia aurantiaca]
MRGGGHRVDRRTVLRAAGALGLLAAVPACSSPFTGTRLTLATGGTQGVYFQLGNALADVWQSRLDLDTRPEVLSTAGSVDNLQLLTSGAANVAISQVDAAADKLESVPADDQRQLRALARIYDDVVHVVVPASSPARSLGGLRGARVSVGAPESGVAVIARRLLAVAGLSPDTDFQTVQLGINDSVAAMERNEIDAFFWVGGLPTEGVSRLAELRPIRLLDLEDLISPVRAEYPVYAPGTVTAGSYGIPEAIVTLLVRNFLLVRADMPDDLAYALVESLFDAQEKLTAVIPAALTIDPRSAIGTQPVPLHPGAERFFQAVKPI